jgi:hypothetical protein
MGAVHRFTETAIRSTFVLTQFLWENRFTLFLELLAGAANTAPSDFRPRHGHIMRWE